MSSWDDTRHIEAIAKKQVEPFLKRHLGDIVWVDKKKMDRQGLEIKLQKNCGDAFFNSGGEMKVAELKSERVWTGNLFLEIFSNRKWNTPGWMFELKHCDLLVYYFLNWGDHFVGSELEHRQFVYVVNFKKLTKWAFVEYDVDQIPIFYRGPIKDVKLAEQHAHKQLNDSWGHLWPIPQLARHVLVRGFMLDKNRPEWEEEMWLYDSQIYEFLGRPDWETYKLPVQK